MASKTEHQIIIETFFKSKGIKITQKEIKALEKSLKKAQTASAKTSSSLKGLGGLATTAGLAFGAAEILSFAKDSIALAEEQARVESQLEAVITSTGGAAGLTADEVKRLASELQGITNFGDEATIAGQNLLLTFTNIGKDVFPQTTATMQDMSVALGQNLKSSALQLGKALNDPVAGVSALREVGVSFTAEQQNVIKSLAETGQVAEAQKLILEELNKEFGGSAEAARDSSSGIEAMMNAIGDLQEVIGAQAIPTTQRWTDSIRKSVEAWSFVLGEAIPAITAVNNEILAANDASGKSMAEVLGLLTNQEEQRKAVAKVTDRETQAKLINAHQTLANARAQSELNAELAQSQRATSAATARMQGLANAYKTSPQMVKQKRDLEDIRLAHLDRVEAEEQAEKQADRLGSAMSSSLRDAASEMSSIISGAIRPTLDEVWKPPEDAANMDEAARRLATVSTAGFGSEWLNQLNQQFTGMSFWQPIADAMAAGDDAGLKEAANNILTNQVTQLWDKELIKQQVRQQLQQQQMRDAIIQEVQNELGAEGVTASIGVITEAAGDTAAASQEVEASVQNVGETATAVAAVIKSKFEGEALPAILELNRQLKIMTGLLNLVEANANGAAGALNGVGIPGRGGGAGNGAIDQQAALGGAPS